MTTWQTVELTEDAKTSKFLNGHLPINFLYRHAIECFLKSLILGIHRTLRLCDGSGAHSPDPAIPMGNWKVPLWRVHSIAVLYAHFRSLLEQHRKAIGARSRTDWWTVPPELERWIATINEADAWSTFFRYPAVSDAEEDLAKSSWRETTVYDVFARLGPDGEYVKAYFGLGNDDMAVGSYMYDPAVFEELHVALKVTASLLSGAHTGMRVELAGGS